MSKERLRCFAFVRLVLLAIYVMLIVTACGRHSSSIAPDELVGTWSAEGALYAGRTLEIRSDQLRFGTGKEEPAEPLAIVKVYWEEGIDHTLYSIEYQSPDGDEFVLPLKYSPGSAELRLANRDQVVWRLRTSS